MTKRKLTPEEAPDFNTRERERLFVVYQRIEFVEGRIAIRKTGDEAVWRDIKEAVALRWLLDYIGVSTPPKSEG